MVHIQVAGQSAGGAHDDRTPTPLSTAVISLASVAMAIVAATVAMIYPLAFLLPLAMLAVLVLRSSVDSRFLETSGIHRIALWLTCTILVVGVVVGLILTAFLTPIGVEVTPAPSSGWTRTG